MLRMVLNKLSVILLGKGVAAQKASQTAAAAAAASSIVKYSISHVIASSETRTSPSTVTNVSSGKSRRLALKPSMLRLMRRAVALARMLPWNWSW